MKVDAKRVSALVLVVLLTITLLAGCTSKPAGEAGKETKQQSAEVKEVKVGVALPLSGNIAQTGNLIKAAMELAAEVVNNKYPDLQVPMAETEGFPNFGGAKLKLVFVDTQNIPEKGMSAVEQLITQEKVHAVMGAYSSAVTATASQAAERLGVPFLNENSTSPSLRRGFKWWNRVTPDDDLFTKNFFEFLKDMKEKKGKDLGKTIALMYENTLWGADVAKAIKKYAPQFGYQIVADIPYTARSASLTSEVQQLKKANADIVMLASYVSDAILIQKTFKDLDYIPPVILAQDSGHNDPNFVGTVGNLADYVLSREVWSPSLEKLNPSIPKINEMFKAKTGFNLDGNTARGFMGILVMADAISRAKSLSPEDIKKALDETNIPKEKVIFPWDGIKFDKDGEIATGRGIVVQIQDKKYVAVWPFEIATHEVILPIPKWSERKQ